MKHLSKTELLSQTKNLVAQERKITNELIAHLEEIQTRRIFSELGYSSMWEFATHYLGLSEGAAQRRISAMRLICAVPEAKAALETGKLSLSNAAKIQSFRQAEKKSGREIDGAEIVSRMESKSQSECAAILHSISPTALPTEKQRIVSPEGDLEIRVVVSREIQEKFTRLKDLLAHAHPNPTFAELIEIMADQAIEAVEKKKGLAEKSTAAEIVPEATADKPGSLPTGKRVYLPIRLRRAVWKKSGGRCEYLSPEGRRCQSKHRLEVDHIIPLALNGSNDLNNLRILCKNHNLQQADEKLGQFFAL